MTARRVVALSGGVGGAKLALGLYKALSPGQLCVIVNTGDDFDHLGLRICPDIDTVLYTLSGLADPQQGWGRKDETWSFLNTLQELGGETWFRLGDRDLALHVHRTHRLANGDLLSTLTQDIAAMFDIRAQIIPMTDAAVRTQLRTTEGDLKFQDYFVRRRCAPIVRSIDFDGAASASPSAALQRALLEDVDAIIICPSNPYLSIDPILAIPGMRQLLRSIGAPIVAVTPLIGTQAVKGPTAKLMQDWGIPPSATAIAEHYSGFIDGFVLDERDSHLKSSIVVPVLTTGTLMQTLENRVQLARDTVAFAARLRA